MSRGKSLVRYRDRRQGYSSVSEGGLTGERAKKLGKKVQRLSEVEMSIFKFLFSNALSNHY
jgi:hypothetical protein